MQTHKWKLITQVKEETRKRENNIWEKGGEKIERVDEIYKAFELSWFT